MLKCFWFFISAFPQKTAFYSFSNLNPTGEITDGSLQKKMERGSKQKRPWSNEPKVANPDMELCKVMQSFQKSLVSHEKVGESEISADMHYCMSLAERMAALDKRMKVFVRHQIEKIFFDIEFGSGMFPYGFQGPQSQNDHQMFQQHEFARRITSTPQHLSREFEGNNEFNNNQYTTLS